MAPINFFSKTVYNMNAKEYAKVINEAAKRSKNIAMDLVSEAGIRGNVTSQDVIRLTSGKHIRVYDQKGNLTDFGAKAMLKSIKSVFGLSTDEAAKKVTIEQLIKNSVANAEKETNKGFETIA